MTHRSLTAISYGVRGGVLGVFVLALVVLAAANLAASPLHTTVQSTPHQAALAAATVAPAPAGSSPCWVTGDIVGDANPAVVYARLCNSATD